jgi:trehalose-phosphatase
MSEPLEDAVEQMVARYCRGHRMILLFGYDGALTKLAVRPWQAELPSGTRRILSELSALPRVSVGIISGRELDDLKRRVGLGCIFYAATDGLELEFQGKTVVHPLVKHSVPLMNAVAKALEPQMRDFPTAWVERKRFGLTVHYRRLELRLVPHLHLRIGRELAAWPERLHVVTGAKAVEITPQLGWTKGTAVEFVLEQLGPGPCLVLYAGDEASDVEALWNVGIHRGITIGVGSRQPTIAQFELPDVESVKELLDQLGHQLRAGSFVANALP